MGKPQDRVSKLETMAGIEGKRNPFKGKQSFAFTPDDWTVNEYFRYRMGDESLMDKSSRTNWEGFTGEPFLSQLSDDNLRAIIDRLEQQEKAEE
ncbi:MAG: hypothetical protein ACYCV0_19675 [Desulfitobacteriaceae bacterium]